MRRLGFGVLIVALSSMLIAQTPSTPSFETAAVKPNTSGANGMFRVMPGGRFNVVNMPLKSILGFAYQLRLEEDDRVIGLPEWTGRERFDIEAKTPSDVEFGTFGGFAPTAPSAGLLMVRALLAERFQLKLHTETREMPVYALVMAHSDKRLGLKLTRSDMDCERLRAERRSRQESVAAPPPGQVRPCAMFTFRNRIAFGSQSIAALANYLTLSRMLGRLVVDRTGLAGLFDFELIWTPDQLPRPDSPDRIRVNGTEIDLTGGVTVDPNGAALLTALREQLGLKVDSTRGPVDVLVIDSVSRPTPD